MGLGDTRSHLCLTTVLSGLDGSSAGCATITSEGALVTGCLCGAMYATCYLPYSVAVSIVLFLLLFR